MKIKVITAANFRYKDLVIESMIQCKKFGYDYQVYDLGGLGFGKPFSELNKRFQEKGFYSEFNKEVGWYTRALFKPNVVKDALECDPDTMLLWLDADAKIEKNLGEVGANFDMALVIREKMELEYGDCAGGWIKKLFGKYNAGVIFFKPTQNTRTFVEHWKNLTAKIGNDQYALHLLKDKEPIRIKELPCIYNDSKLTKETIIYHLKGKRKKQYSLCD